jgi:hypothetical protein
VGGHVFISYSRADRAYVDKLAAHLRLTGIPVWYDYELGAGDRFDAEIEQQINTCAGVVVVLTPELGRFDLGTRRVQPRAQGPK